MAFKGTKDTGYKRRKFTGLVNFQFEPEMVNPTKAQIEEFTGYDLDKEPVYTSVKEVGSDRFNAVRLDFWGTARGVTSDGEIIEVKDKVTLFLEDRLNNTKDGKMRFTDFRSEIDTMAVDADTLYDKVSKDADMQKWFLYYKDDSGNRVNSNSLRALKVGELMLYKLLMRACGIRSTDPADPVKLENWAGLFDNDTSEIRGILSNFNTPESPVSVEILAYITEKGYQAYYPNVVNKAGDTNPSYIIKAADNEFGGVKGNYQKTTEFKLFDDAKPKKSNSPAEESVAVVEEEESDDLPF